MRSLFTLLGLFLIPSFALAAGKFDPDARAMAIAPYLSEQTFLIIHGDLTKVDVDAFFRRLIDISKADAKEFEKPNKELKEMVEGMTKSGVKEIYVLFDLNDPFDQPVWLFPLAKDADAKAVLEMVKEMRLESTTMDGTIVAGTQNAIARIKKKKPAARPEVAKAFAAAGDTAGQVLFVPTMEIRKAFEESLPNLPKEIGGGSIKTFTRGVQWAAAGIDVTPKAAVQMTIQSPNADFAKELHATLLAVMKEAAKHEEIKRFIPEPDKTIAVLTPKLDGDKLTLKLDDAALVTVLTPVVQQAREAAKRQVAANNIRQLIVAMHNYANSNNGKLPGLYSVDKDKKPLLSWRVHLLPFLGEEQLYKQFKLDEPWDSDHNQKLIEKMPAIFRSPISNVNDKHMTTFLAPFHPDSIWNGPEGLTLTQIANADGTSNTIALLDVSDDRAVPWTKPQDLAIDPKDSKKGLEGHYPGQLLGAFCDGSVRFLSAKLSSDDFLSTLLWKDGKFPKLDID